MTGQQLRNSILLEAIQGRLVPNVLQSGEKTGAELLQIILAERQKNENEEKGKRAKKLTLSTIEEEPWELPDGWCWCKLGDIIYLLSGRDLEPHQYNAAQNGIPYITGASNFDNGSIIINRWTPSPICVSSFGDLLITCKGTVGELAFNTIGKIHIARQIMAISAILVDSNYIQVFLKAKVNDLNAQANGVIPGISREDILLADFPLPPLSIQKAITKKIEELFPLVDEYDKAARELQTLNEILPDKLRKAVLQEAIKGALVSNDIPEGEATAPELLQHILKERQERENKEKGKKAYKLTLSTIEEEPWELPDGWCWCKLGDMFEIVRGGSPRPIKDYITTDENGYNWIKIGDTDKGGKYITGAKEKIIREGLKKTRLVHSGDLLLTNSMSFGRPYILKIDGCIHDGWLVLSPYIKELNKEFMFYLLSTPYVYDVFSVKAAGGVVNNLKTEKVIDTIVPLPPLSIQHRIVEKIEEVFSAINSL